MDERCGVLSEDLGSVVEVGCLFVEAPGHFSSPRVASWHRSLCWSCLFLRSSRNLELRFEGILRRCCVDSVKKPWKVKSNRQSSRTSDQTCQCKSFQDSSVKASGFYSLSSRSPLARFQKMALCGHNPLIPSFKVFESSRETNVFHGIKTDCQLVGETLMRRELFAQFFFWILAQRDRVAQNRCLPFPLLLRWRPSQTSSLWKPGWACESPRFELWDDVAGTVGWTGWPYSHRDQGARCRCGELGCSFLSWDSELEVLPDFESIKAIFKVHPFGQLPKGVEDVEKYRSTVSDLPKYKAKDWSYQEFALRNKWQWREPWALQIWMLGPLHLCGEDQRAPQGQWGHAGSSLYDFALWLDRTRFAEVAAHSVSGFARGFK